MSEEIFLIDANSLITPHLTFYPFDFAPGFWSQLEQSIQDGRIAILDMVKAEILHGNDNLKESRGILIIVSQGFFRNMVLSCSTFKIVHAISPLR